MHIRLLGPMELRTEDGGLATIAGAKRRGVLALLAMELGRSVPVERFFELLWGEEPPAQAKAALQGHIAALRKVLAGSSFELLTRAPGYVLTGDPEAVDALRFQTLTARAAATPDDRQAARLIREALAMWQDPVLADLPDTPLRQTLADRLDDSRVRATEAWAACELRLGNGAVVIPALELVARTDGLREPSLALLMRCLHQAGRGSDALQVFQEATIRLDEELGIPPGPVLQAAYAAIHRAEPQAQSAALVAPASASPSAAEPETQPESFPAAPSDVGPPATRGPIPQMLPRQTAGFVGRTRESMWLDQELGAERAGSGLAVVVGLAGVGKTATVVRWAHSAAAGFPDGQLFTDLRGFDPSGPMDPADALGDFLRALRVPEARIPEDPDARSALYREQTQDRRLLVVIDNAATAGDVLPLLPAHPACATVVTSRNALEDLIVTQGASVLPLDVLAPKDSWALLGRLLTPERVRAEEDAARRLIALCDHLPLALRIAAARLATRPGWTVADLVAALEDERTRLLALDIQGAVSVRTALAFTHRHLAAKAAHLLALLTAHPGTEVDAPSAAALLGSDIATARTALSNLAAYHLLDETAPGRYSRHDLIRLYGAELLAEQGPEAHREAVARLLDYYLAAVAHAAVLPQPLSRVFPPLEYPPGSLPRITGVSSALAWFRLEEATVRPLVQTAARSGEYERAWRLAESCNGLYHGAGRVADRLKCLRSGLAAARHLADPEAIATLEASTASALIESGREQDALAHAEQAVGRTTPQHGHVHIHALATLALAHAVVGNLDRADGLSESALALIRDTGLMERAAFTLSNASAIKGMSGDAETALRYAREARQALRDHPDATYHLSAMVNEAHALQDLGQREEAEAVWTETLARCRSAGSLHLHALTEHHFADFLLEEGRTAEAVDHLRAAIALYDERGNRAVAEELTDQLAALAHQCGPEAG
ncbi:AfsR/SARP family transcriptional regulator [Streptomyces lunalinharesii]|uniref:BTAD domain-containing putative transcriptional regulator n=1 Tax=Streptomyces lunalinharesii TaxID=333384 RepID=A0ABN3SKV7_9ACTN